MSGYELMLRITNRLNKEGYTFDPEKIAEIEKAKEEQAREEFLNRARSYWKGG